MPLPLPFPEREAKSRRRFTVCFRCYIQYIVELKRIHVFLTPESAQIPSVPPSLPSSPLVSGCQALKMRNLEGTGPGSHGRETLNRLPWEVSVLEVHFYINLQRRKHLALPGEKGKASRGEDV